MARESIEPTILKSLLEEMIKEVFGFSECQSIAVRLNKNGDFPYYLQIGFPEFFLLKENSLNVRDKRGKLVLDSDDTPLLECMCGNILKRRFNPELPYFTRGGTFWTNSTTQLLNSLTEKERRKIGRTRNTCHNYGYESVALVPIHANGEVVGLIQINDPRENMFTLRKVEKYELMADHIGCIIWNIRELYEKAAHKAHL